MLVNLNDVLKPGSGRAVGLFNTVNMELARGTIAAAEELGSPVVIGTAEVLLPYVARIVRNVSLKAYWRREAAKRSGRYTVALEELEGCVADGHSLEDEIGAKELAHIIGSFLDGLSRENRVIFMRRYWFADSCRDIAALTGLSEKNVSVRLSRMRAKLKQYLIEMEVFV